MDYQATFLSIQAHPQYQKNIDWGRVRNGHPEGTVRAHIAELEKNLDSLKGRLSEEEYWKLKILIHVHDTFKVKAKQRVRISDPDSHASLARAFLESFCEDKDLLNIVQYHDEPYALWRKYDRKGVLDAERMSRLLENITDWELFLAFTIIDGSTEGKSRDPIRWLFKELDGKIKSRFSAEDIPHIYIDPIELDRIQLWGGGVIIPTPSPIVFHPEVDYSDFNDHERILFIRDSELNIDVWGLKRDELIESLKADLDSMWRIYALAEDSILCSKAVELKNALKLRFRHQCHTRRHRKY